MHLWCDRWAAKDLSETGVADNCILEIQLSKHHNEEPPIAENKSEYVVIIRHDIRVSTDKSAVELVEDIHEHESLEQEGVVLSSYGSVTIFVSDRGHDQVILVLIAKHARGEQQKENHEELVQRLAVDRSIHRWGDEFTMVVLNRLKFVRLGNLCGEGKSCSDIHNEVDP
jgi:hypothetical protein